MIKSDIAFYILDV